MADECWVFPKLSESTPGEEPSSCACKWTTKLGLGCERFGQTREERLALCRGKRTFSEAFIWRLPTSALDTCWGVFGVYMRNPLLQGKFSLVAALISQRANEHRASGDVRACYLVFVE